MMTSRASYPSHNHKNALLVLPSEPLNHLPEVCVRKCYG
jgi:hypothetical protein